MRTLIRPSNKENGGGGKTLAITSPEEESNMARKKKEEAPKVALPELDQTEPKNDGPPVENVASSLEEGITLAITPPEEEDVSAISLMASFRVVTDRRPVWENIRQPLNAIITAPRDDEAIAAMLEREWIVEA